MRLEKSYSAPVSNFVTIYFSKDRPLQLDLTLQSNFLCHYQWAGQEEYVIYKASNEEYERAYQRVKEENQPINFVKETDFKKNLISVLDKNHWKYVMFVVDDTIFTGNYSAFDIGNALDFMPEAIGFSLRLGKNTEYCYPHASDNIMPPINPANIPSCPEIHMANWWNNKFGDFAYPLELSSSVYRARDILGMLRILPFDNPNSLEWELDKIKRGFISKPMLLFYEKSVAFSNPVNKCQDFNNNRFANVPEYATRNLLALYKKGFRANPKTYIGFTSNGCHQEVELDFIKVGEEF